MTLFSNVPSAASVADADYVLGLQGSTGPGTGNTAKMTLQQIVNLVGTGPFPSLSVTGNASIGGALTLSGNALQASASLGIIAASSGLINLKNANGTIFQAKDNGQGTIANFIQVLPNSTTHTPLITVDGADTNIDLVLSCKGTGIVRTNSKTFRGYHLSGRTDLLAGTTWSGGGSAEGISNLYVTGGVDGTSSSRTAAANYFGITFDKIAAGSNGFQGFQIDYNFGDATNFTGSRRVFQVNATMTAAPSDTNQQYSAGQFNMGSSFNCGGTSGNESGILYGLNPSVGLFNGATFYRAFVGMETDLAARTGTSYDHLDGVSVILNSPHAVRGTGGYDSAFVAGSQVGISAGFDFVLRIGGPGGPWPVNSDGTLVGLIQGSTSMTAANGVDFSLATFSGSAFKSTGFAVDGSGNITAPSVGNGATALQVAGAGSWSANGSVATSLTSVGPTGSHTTVQEWFTVKNASGVTRYIPAF